MMANNIDLDRFTLDKKSKIVIYGFGIVGKYLYNNLKKQGFDIIYFLDKNAEGLREKIPDNLNIYSLEKYPANAEFVYIITLQNGLLHQSIAKLLYENRIDKILFLPLDTYAGYETERGMFRSYYQLFSHSIGCITAPGYSKFISIDLSGRNNILLESDSFLIVNIPIELIHSCSRVLPNKEHPFSVYYSKDELEETEYSTFDMNISLMNMYIKLFEYLDDKRDVGNEIEEYMNINTPSQFKENKKMFLKDRYSLFLLYEKKFKEGLDFFINSAPPAVYNSRGYVNLLDGHHRCCYLVYKGMEYIPVMLQKEDYKELIQSDKASKLIQLVQDRATLPVPVEYIFTRNISAVGEEYFLDLAVAICRCLIGKRIKIKGENVVCIGKGASYFARWFYREGAKQVIEVLVDEEVDMANEANKLLCNNSIKTYALEEIDNLMSEKFNIGVIFDNSIKQYIKTHIKHIIQVSYHEKKLNTVNANNSLQKMEELLFIKYSRQGKVVASLYINNKL